MVSIKYPATGPTYGYSFDSMARPLSLSGGTTSITLGATCGQAGGMIALSCSGIGESRTKPSCAVAASSSG